LEIGQRVAAHKPLWRCPKCRRRFANRNQSHACGRHDLAHHFRGKPREIRALYEAFARAVRSCGRVTVLPEKTRIAFQVRMSFAQVTPRSGSLDGISSWPGASNTRAFGASSRYLRAITSTTSDSPHRPISMRSSVAGSPRLMLWASRGTYTGRRLTTSWGKRERDKLPASATQRRVAPTRTSQ
jgi:hypothetical protein